MIAAGARPAHAELEMQRATVPATCGEAMLVPDSVAKSPLLFEVERMQTLGAAIVCDASALPGVVQLLKSAAVSSTSGRHVAAARPPGIPSKSAIPVAVRTSSYAAGTVLAKSALSLAAPATIVIPLLVAPQIALWMESLLEFPQLPSSVPVKRRLIFATVMPLAAALFATQSIPQTSQEARPEPLVA